MFVYEVRILSLFSPSCGTRQTNIYTTLACSPLVLIRDLPPTSHPKTHSFQHVFGTTTSRVSTTKPLPLPLGPLPLGPRLRPPFAPVYSSLLRSLCWWCLYHILSWRTVCSLWGRQTGEPPRFSDRWRDARASRKGSSSHGR